MVEKILASLCYMYMGLKLAAFFPLWDYQSNNLLYEIEKSFDAHAQVKMGRRQIVIRLPYMHINISL